jgi:hypothetical protein
MLLQLEGLFERGLEFGVAVREANIKTRDGLKVARIFWSVLEHIKEFETERKEARRVETEVIEMTPAAQRIWEEAERV